jgi:hypothetical protein
LGPILIRLNICIALFLKRKSAGLEACGPLLGALGRKQMLVWVLLCLLSWEPSLGKVVADGAIVRKVFPYYDTNFGTSSVYTGADTGNPAYVG